MEIGEMGHQKGDGVPDKGYRVSDGDGAPDKDGDKGDGIPERGWVPDKRKGYQIVRWGTR